MDLKQIARATGGTLVTSGDNSKAAGKYLITWLGRNGFEDDGDNIYVSGKVGRNYNITLTLQDKKVLFNISTQFNQYGGTISLNDKTTDKIKEVVALYKQLESIKFPKYVQVAR